MTPLSLPSPSRSSVFGGDFPLVAPTGDRRSYPESESVPPVP